MSDDTTDDSGESSSIHVSTRGDATDRYIALYRHGLGMMGINEWSLNLSWLYGACQAGMVLDAIKALEAMKILVGDLRVLLNLRGDFGSVYMVTSRLSPDQACQEYSFDETPAAIVPQLVKPLNAPDWAFDFGTPAIPTPGTETICYTILQVVKSVDLHSPQEWLENAFRARSRVITRDINSLQFETNPYLEVLRGRISDRTFDDIRECEDDEEFRERLKKPKIGEAGTPQYTDPSEALTLPSNEESAAFADELKKPIARQTASSKDSGQVGSSSKRKPFTIDDTALTTIHGLRLEPVTEYSIYCSKPVHVGHRERMYKLMMKTLRNAPKYFKHYASEIICPPDWTNDEKCSFLNWADEAVPHPIMPGECGTKLVTPKVHLNYVSITRGKIR